MTDPIVAGYIANLGSDLTLGVLGMLGRRLREALKGTPRQQALKRCYQAATIAFLPENDPASESYRPILQHFFAQPAVQAELAKLVKGREPDQEILIEFFEEATAKVDGLPLYDFPTRLAAAVEAFLEIAEEEEALAEVIQTTQLRDAAKSLREIAPDVRVIRQVMQQPNETTIPIPQNISPALRRAVVALDSEYPEIRKSNIKTIANSSDPMAFEILMLAVKHPTLDVRANALFELVSFSNNPRMIPTLIEVLDGDDRGIWNQACNKLPQFGQSAIPKLLEALFHQNPKVRYGVVVILGKIGDPVAVPNLIKALQDEDANVRCGAAKALGEIKDTTAVSALAQLLSDTAIPEWTGRRVCDAADVALQQIGTPEALAARQGYNG